MEKTPLVSVIIPSYNHEKYISQCIESIINQTYKNYELIVIDDGSCDNSVILLEELCKKYKFRLYLQQNMGLAATLNKYIKEFVIGEYIALCASDDFWPPNKLSIQVEYMKKNPTIPMCYGKAYFVDRNSNLIKDYPGNRDLRGGYIFEDIITQKFHPPVNYMIKRATLLELGLFRKDCIAEDFYMNCLISYKYLIGFIDEYLCYYRVEALGKKRDPLKLLLDHRKTIDLFRENDIYPKAVVLSNLRMFNVLSCYKKHKLLSLKYMFFSIPLCFSRKFLAGIYHLIFIGDNIFYDNQ
jgi:glycosyltransferase involved in cell wall biosynthesis